MLLWLLAARLLSAAHADKEPELPGWPFGDPDYINRTATSMAPFLRALPDQCILWNSSCQSGNRPEALDEFFNNNGTMSALVYNPWEYYAQHRNETGIPLDTNSMILSWMRDPDCRSSFFEWHTEHLDQPNWTYTNRVDNSDVSTTINWSAIATTSVPYGCCDACELIAGDVDVFYWPVPGANTDCVTLVGTTAASNIDQSLIIPDDSGIGGGWWNPQRDPYLLISTSSSSNPAPLQSLNARDYALLSAPPNSAESLVTAIQRGFTFTSPSIYVNFTSLYAVDRCGPIGTFISYTMLSFTPGELYTIEFPLWSRVSIPLSATKSFNFADLPCPPQDVMMSDQYKPAPGSPYRPVLASPSQVFHLQSGWSNCSIFQAFIAIDPPRALMRVSALLPSHAPTSPQSRSAGIMTTDSEKPASRPPEASVTGAMRDPSPAPAHESKVAGPTSTPSPSAPSTAIKDPHTPKTSLDPQKAQHAKIHSRLKGWQARISSEVASRMQVSSKKAKDSSIQDSFKDGSFITPPNTETSREPLDVFQPSKVSSDQKSSQKATLSPNWVTSDPLSTSEERYEDSATKPLTRTAQTPSPKDDPSRTGASFDPDTSPSPDSLRPGSIHPQGTSIDEAGSLRSVGQSDGDISAADSRPPDSTKGYTNRPSTRIINNSPTDPAAVANTAGDPGLGPETASSSPSPHHDPSPNDQGNTRPQPQTSPPNSNADGGSASTPPSASKPLVQPPDPPTPPASVPSHLTPPRPQSDPSPSKAADPTASLKGVDPGSPGPGPSSLIDSYSQTQSPVPPALGINQTTNTAAAAAAAAQTQARAPFQPPSNNTDKNTNTDPHTNISSTASERQGGGGGGGGGGGKARPSSSSSSQGDNGGGNASSVLPFQNGGEGKGIGVLIWNVGLGGCVGVMFPLYFI